MFCLFVCFAGNKDLKVLESVTESFKSRHVEKFAGHSVKETRLSGNTKTATTAQTVLQILGFASRVFRGGCSGKQEEAQRRD